MKWFKHMSDAGFNKNLDLLIRQYGPRAYMSWFLLLEFAASQWDGYSEPEFTWTWFTLRNILRTKLDHTRNIMGSYADHNMIVLGSSGDLVTVKIPKLWELKHKDATNSKNRPALVGPPGPPRIEKSRVEKNMPPTPKRRKASPKLDVVWFENLYTSFPERLGGHTKQRAYKKLASQKDLDKELFTKAHGNYCAFVRNKGEEGTEFVKDFANFCDPAYWQKHIQLQQASSAKTESRDPNFNERGEYINEAGLAILERKTLEMRAARKAREQLSNSTTQETN